MLDAMVVLTTAAAVTERLRVGFGVLILPLRPVAAVAKQVSALQTLSGNRVLLGVGSGGTPHGVSSWQAVGVPQNDRGRLTAPGSLLDGTALAPHDDEPPESSASLTLLAASAVDSVCKCCRGKISVGAISAA